MPQSAKEDLREAVEREVAELESLCAVIEVALAQRDWGAFAEAMADSRRVTHAMSNAMDAAVPVRDADFDTAIFGRARRVYTIRENQVARLRSYNAAVGERLAQIGKVRRLARAINTKGVAPARGLLDDLR